MHCASIAHLEGQIRWKPYWRRVCKLPGVILLHNFVYLSFLTLICQSLVIFCFWCAVFPALLDPNNDFASATDRPNLFFSSWGAFIIAWVLVVKHYQHFMDKQDDMIMHWLGFAAASLVAMMAAARLWQDDYICQKPVHKAEHFCRRSFFTFVFGALSGIVAVFMAFTNVKKLQFPYQV